MFDTPGLSVVLAFCLAFVVAAFALGFVHGQRLTLIRVRDAIARRGCSAVAAELDGRVVSEVPPAL